MLKRLNYKQFSNVSYAVAGSLALYATYKSEIWKPLNFKQNTIRGGKLVYIEF